eukprot:2726146-Lingulodinium_polyedra.AAC.1
MGWQVLAAPSKRPRAVLTSSCRHGCVPGGCSWPSELSSSMQTCSGPPASRGAAEAAAELAPAPRPEPRLQRGELAGVVPRLPPRESPPRRLPAWQAAFAPSSGSSVSFP